MSGDKQLDADIPPHRLPIAVARVAKDYLGNVPGLHGVAPAYYDGKPAIGLLANTDRPPASHRIPQHLIITVQGVNYRAPLVWLKVPPHHKGAVVIGDEQVVIDG